MVGTYDYWLVLLSVVVGITASYVALDLASRVAASQGRKSRAYWLAGGAISMGTGIWSMHFIGMLAFHLPIPVSYDIPISLLSLLIAIAAAGFALVWVSFGRLSSGRLLAGGLSMGAAIIFMHYTGMAAMRMEPPIQYQPLAFGLSVLVAVAASVAALLSAFRLRMETVFTAFWKKAGSAFVMGTAIFGMHYAGMAAAAFSPDSVCTVTPQNIDHVGLAGTLGGFTLLFLTATLLVSAFDAYLAERSSKHAKALGEANELIEARVVERTAELARTNQSLREQIAEREQAEKSLRQAQTRTESILNSTADTYILWDREWRYLDVNEAGVRAIGRPREQILGRTLWELYPDTVGTEFERQCRRAMDERVPVVFDFHYAALDTWWENRLFPAPEGLAAFGTDITERKVADERIRESEARLRAFMNNSPEVMFIKDLHGRYLHVNPQFLRSFGLDREAVLSRTDAEIFPPDQAARFKATDARVLATGAPVVFEDTARYTDGLHTGIVCKFPFVDAQGRTTALGGIATDITERKRVEQEVRASREQLQALAARLNAVREEERVSIALNMHDELGQTLTSVKIDVSLLEQAVKSRKGRPSSTHILRELRSAKRTIDKALDAVRRIAGDLRPAVLNEAGLAAAIEWLAKDFQKRARIKCRAVLSSQFSEPGKERSTALYRILQEALTNVARHAAAKRVEIELKEDGDKYVLQIRDDGIGLPEERLNDWRSLGLNGMRERTLMSGAPRSGGSTRARRRARRAPRDSSPPERRTRYRRRGS